MSLPRQKIAFSKKDEEWKKDTINHYELLSYSSTASNRNTNYNKKINYDLFNGKFNKADLEYVCNPLGLKDNEFPATLQHYDIISPALNLLIGEETKRNDNCLVVSDSPNDINRKQQALKDQINQALQAQLLGTIDPSTIDPNNPPPTPEQVIKYAKHNISDLIESQANKILKFVKKDLNTKEVFKKGWKDTLITSEEIYWSGVSNNQLIFKRCNPLNTTIVLDGDSDYVDDALAVVEVRMLSPSTIIDEWGKELTPAQVDELEAISRRYSSVFNNFSNNPTFTVDRQSGVLDTGVAGFSSLNSTAGSFNSELIRTVRVEWKSFKKMFHLTYTDEDGQVQEQLVDESFKLPVFKQAFPDASTEELWINEAWEGVKIGHDIYIGVQPKENQRRRMDNPYSCKLGYTGLIYNSMNAVSVSLIDRLKPYQYLYNIISYRLELAFASDQGKIMLMDLAQIPRSEGMDLDRWLYYLKAMKIGFINSFEEGRKGSHIGKLSTFNQFQSIDLSLANQIQQYIQTLDFIKQQVAFISGVSPQRLGAIQSQELVGNVERSVQQSALITEYLFDSHDEVKRRAYTSLIECAKIAFKDGKKVQYVLDYMGIELLDIAELELDNSEFNVHISNSKKDNQVLETVKQLAAEAMKADKANFSTIIDTIINDNPRDIIRNIQKGEEDKLKRDADLQKQQQAIEQSKIDAQKQMHSEVIAEKQKDRDLQQYIADANNETKVTVQEIANYFKAVETDTNANGIPDPIEIANHALAQRELDSKNFLEHGKLVHDKGKHDKEMSIKEKEIASKKEVENKKLEAVKTQNANQIELANKKHIADSKMMDKKMELEKMKAKAAIIKSRKTPKK